MHKFEPPYFFWIEKFWKSVYRFGKSRSFCFGNHILHIKINELYILYMPKNQSVPKWSIGKKWVKLDTERGEIQMILILSLLILYTLKRIHIRIETFVLSLYVFLFIANFIL